MNYPFTPQGVREWQENLYAQSDEAVRQEAEFAFIYFEDWMTQRFSLDETQQAYLHQLDYAHMRFAADGVYFAVRHRLPIILEKPEKTKGPHVRGAKLEELIKQFESADGEQRTASFKGQFIARISY